MECVVKGFGLNGSEPRCSPSFVVCDTGEGGFLTESVNAVSRYSQSSAAAPARFSDYPRFLIGRPNFAAENLLAS